MIFRRSERWWAWPAMLIHVPTIIKIETSRDWIQQLIDQGDRYHQNGSNLPRALVLHSLPSTSIRRHAYPNSRPPYFTVTRLLYAYFLLSSRIISNMFDVVLPLSYVLCFSIIWVPVYICTVNQRSCFVSDIAFCIDCSFKTLDDLSSTCAHGYFVS